MPPLTLAQSLQHSVTALREAEIDSPELDARILVGHTLGLERAEMFGASARVLSESEQKQIQNYITRRANHEPVGRIIGKREFWSLSFGLNEATLEPRPDSETLVEIALKKYGIPTFAGMTPPVATDVTKNTVLPAQAGIPFSMTPDSHLRILDLGTGTGCLLLSLLHEIPHATGLGIDIAPRAIEQAQQNAHTLNLESRCRFQVGDWLEGLDEKFDLIISNPPYIPAADIPTLMPEVRTFDPRLALDGGEDGLSVYRFLIPRLMAIMKPTAHVLFEVGQGQADAVQKLLTQHHFTSVTAHPDLAGVARCVEGGMANKPST